MATVCRWCMGIFIAALITVGPYLYYRFEYTRYRRFRVVESGKLYRSGSMTAAGFRDVVRQYGIRTVLNVRDDCPEPVLDQDYFTSEKITERELCKEMGVRYVFLPPDLVNRLNVDTQRPKAIDQFLALMDDPANQPVLLHCKAGLHRTGCLAAVYRMEYNHWPMEQALIELKNHGFGEFVSTKSNHYIDQYLVHFQPRIRSQESGVKGQGSAVRRTVVGANEESSQP